ncbi:MAG: aspartate carbamoyltransferase [Candidatus Aerophobetes bacterium]|nr:aspartate carbamoyltransferase [Candidatus Aerophobetes bacterium]
MKSRDVVSSYQFNREELSLIMDTAAYYERTLIEKRRLRDMEGKIMASLFYEPSTRTRLSFEAAMHRLGGSVITIAESLKSQTSSMAKGESLHDSITVIDRYADVLVVRSPLKEAAEIAAKAAKNPVINAGSGTGQHPTQALLDVYTILKEKGNLEGLAVTLLGDLKYGRTVHSLVDFLSLYDCDLIFVSPKELSMPEDIMDKLRSQGIKVEEKDNLQEAVKNTDVLYATRIQKERFATTEEYERIKDSYIVDDKIVEKSREGMLILHPLPRVNEIAVSVDRYPGAAYFRQAANGVPVRMALLALTTGSVL